MRNKILGLIAAFAMSVSLLFGAGGITPVPTAQAATSIAGCPIGPYRLQMDQWSKDKDYIWLGFDNIPQHERVRAVSNSVYYWCPNGDRDDKIMLMWTQWCFYHLTATPIQFDGVKFNGYHGAGTGTFVWNPPEKVVSRTGTTGQATTKCAEQTMDPNKLEWMKMIADHPQRTVDAWVQTFNYPDQHIDFDTVDGTGIRAYSPGNDVALGPWQN